ncbi:MAG: hypothetical protein JWL86_5057 [Rhizobium sp.]|nr:hypothetical protein [Rhizobium sp.]
MLIYVPDRLVSGDVDRFELVNFVVKFADRMLVEGACPPSDMPRNLMQLYHLDYYVAQVMNGGHYQFIDNCFDDFLNNLQFAIDGLMAIGAYAHLDIIRDFEVWVIKNRIRRVADVDEVDDVEFESLEALDERFGELDHYDALDDLVVRWLLGWENLRVVEDDRVQALIDTQSREFSVKSRSSSLH